MWLNALYWAPFINIATVFGARTFLKTVKNIISSKKTLSV